MNDLRPMDSWIDYDTPFGQWFTRFHGLSWFIHQIPYDSLSYWLSSHVKLQPVLLQSQNLYNHSQVVGFQAPWSPLWEATSSMMPAIHVWKAMAFFFPATGSAPPVLAVQSPARWGGKKPPLRDISHRPSGWWRVTDGKQYICWRFRFGRDSPKLLAALWGDVHPLKILENDQSSLSLHCWELFLIWCLAYFWMVSWHLILINTSFYPQSFQGPNKPLSAKSKNLRKPHRIANTTSYRQWDEQRTATPASCHWRCEIRKQPAGLAVFVSPPQITQVSILNTQTKVHTNKQLSEFLYNSSQKVIEWSKYILWISSTHGGLSLNAWCPPQPHNLKFQNHRSKPR